MKKELITGLFRKFEDARYIYEGIECWSARELQSVFNYSEWRNFLKVIDKAKDACNKSGEAVPHHFVDTNKMIDLAKGAQRQIEDIALTRYACYLVAQNGDPAKRSNYFHFGNSSKRRGQKCKKKSSAFQQAVCRNCAIL